MKNFLEITNKSLVSFGGNDLQENLKKTETALAELKPLQSIWNHSHSQWMWRHLNLSYLHPLKNLRQIAAEIARKQAALEQARWKYAQKQVKAAKLEEEISADLDKWTQAAKEISLGKLTSEMSQVLTLVNGCMKDILTLHDLYTQLKQQVGDVNENDVEAEESKAHLQRSLVQSVRDVRERGAITKGEQEYLEQIGVNPGKVQKLIRNYVEAEQQDEADWSTDGLLDFIRSLTDELIDRGQVDKRRMVKQGFSTFHNPEFSQGDSNGQHDNKI